LRSEPRLIAATLPVAAAEKSGFNVLFIIADDLRCRSLLRRPAGPHAHLDRLAARGVRFDRAYVQYTVCNPACLVSDRTPADETGSSEPHAFRIEAARRHPRRNAAAEGCAGIVWKNLSRGQ